MLSPLRSSFLPAICMMTETVENPPETSAVAQPLLLNDLHRLSLEKLAARGAKLGMRVRVESSRHHMVLDQARFHLSQGGEVLATGFLSSCSSPRNLLRILSFDGLATCNSRNLFLGLALTPILIGPSRSSPMA